MSCWDTTACLKTLCTAYHDYQKSTTDEAIKDLQRQIDVIVGVTSHGASLQDLSPKQMLYAEALSVLVSLINEPNMKNQIYLKAITALLQLSNDYETKEALQYTFNLVSSLINFVLRLPTNTTKQLFSQTLNLLAKLTYKNKNLNLNSMQMFDFLKFIIKKVQTSTSDQCLPSLAILANLCHKNIEVQAHIKSLSDVKILYKTLFKYLSNSSNKAYSVTSLSVLSSLAMEEESGEKIFSGNNLINIIHLVFQAVVTSDNLTILQYSVDLIIDLLNQNKTFKIIAESNKLFETYVIRILNQLHSTDSHIVIKVLELLNAFCGKSVTRRKLVTLLLKQITDADEETQMQDEEISLSPMQATVHWISKIQTLSTSVSRANIQAMNFAREIVNESIEVKGTEALFAYFMELIPICLKNLFVDMKTDEEKVLQQISQRVSTSAELLISLSRDTKARTAILERFNIDHLIQLVNSVYVNYTDDLKAERSPVHQCSDEVVHVVFRSFELMVALKSFIHSGNEKYGALLQDVRLLPFLSRGFVSSSKYLVHASLHIFTEALKYKDFQIKSLGESINLLNQSRQIEVKNLKMGQTGTEKHQVQALIPVVAPPLQDISNMRDSMGNITALTEKLRKGLDIKDSKVSDIMDYYEHKLAALTGRERHLEDLIEAKTQALSQSDRLLGQFRCRQAQADAECLKLRTLLKTSEKKCETDSVRMDQFLKTKNSLESEIGRLNEQIEILQKDSEKLKKLQYQFQEQANKLETVQKRLVASEEENSSIIAMNDCLHKNSEKLKSKLEVSNEHIKVMEGEVTKLNQAINENEQIIKDRDNVIKKAETMYQAKLNEINKLHKEHKDTEKILKKTEKSLQDTRIKVSSLESTLVDQETSLKDKEDQLQQLQEEVDKQAQITAMINNLTSGRMNVNK